MQDMWFYSSDNPLDIVQLKSLNEKVLPRLMVIDKLFDNVHRSTNFRKLITHFKYYKYLNSSFQNMESYMHFQKRHIQFGITIIFFTKEKITYPMKFPLKLPSKFQLKFHKLINKKIK